MPVRIVEGQLPYTGGTGIEIDANKVISLLLREENNLILVNDDNEIYTDLQLASGLTPQSDFPVGVTTGKVLEADGRPQSGLMLNWKTTSGDYARWIYCADGEIYFDGGNGVWRKVYYSSEVDALLQQLKNYVDLNYQPKLTAGAGITIDANNVISAQGAGTGDVSGPNSAVNGHLAVFDGTTGKAIKDGGAMPTIPTKTSDLTNDSGFITSSYHDATKQDVLTAGTNIQIQNNVISATGGSDIVYATQAEYNALLPGALTDGKHYFIYSTSGGGGWQPGVNTIAYYQFEQNLLDSSGNGHDILSGSSYSYVNVGGQYVVEDNGSIDLNIPSGILSGIGTGDFTLSYWMYPIVPVSGASRQPIMFGLTASTTPYPGPCMFFDYYAYGDPEGGLTNPDAQIIWRTARGTHTVGGDTADYVNGWHHFVMTRISGVVYCYVDNIQVAQYNSNTSIGNTNRGYFIGAATNWSPQGWGTSGAKGDSLILENIGWTSQNVSDYFDQTKATYGIS